MIGCGNALNENSNHYLDCNTTEHHVAAAWSYATVDNTFLFFKSNLTKAHARTHESTHARTHAHKSHKSSHLHAYPYAFTPVHISHIHTYTHTYTQTRRHTFTHTYTHACIHAQHTSNSHSYSNNEPYQHTTITKKPQQQQLSRDATTMAQRTLRCCWVDRHHCTTQTPHTIHYPLPQCCRGQPRPCRP